MTHLNILLILLLYTDAMTRDLAVDQHSTWNRSALNHPYRGYPVTVKSSNRDETQHALHCLCLVSKIFILTNVNLPQF